MNFCGQFEALSHSDNMQHHSKKIGSRLHRQKLQQKVSIKIQRIGFVDKNIHGFPHKQLLLCNFLSSPKQGIRASKNPY